MPVGSIDLDEVHVDPVIVAVSKLEQQGVALGHPASSAIKGASFALRELRIKSSGHALRVFYSFDPRRDAEKLCRLRAQAHAENAIEMNLPELRQALGKTQVAVADAAKMAQAKISDFERRDDHILSVLRRYIEALGGKLEVTAVFEDKRVRLKGV